MNFDRTVFMACCIDQGPQDFPGGALRARFPIERSSVVRSNRMVAYVQQHGGPHSPFGEEGWDPCCD